MIRFRLKSGLLAIIVLWLLGAAFYCKPQQDAQVGVSPWRNVYDTTVPYVGMATCKGCHQEVYNTFMETGMGKSFGLATKTKSSADFSAAHALVYDTLLDYYYKPYWQGDSLYIMEYRLGKAGDTVHQRKQKIQYIIGSGQHTNSHIFDVNGFLFQAPITFYTQKHQWDVAPGFEKGANSRFQRMIQLECMSCHNGFPKLVQGSENLYTQVPQGIDCERCHGPGGLHVAEKMAGKVIDTSKGPDYSIVNPRRLSTELQNNVCQRCHLQGITVLGEGKNFYDFRPGMHLKEVMHVFMPNYEGAQDKMIMASHVERMKKSDCYVTSGKLSCITCHNPHVSVKFTPKAQYLNACMGCHGQQSKTQCSGPKQARMANNDDCIQCHMPKNGSIDIPHVAVTDHYIRRNPTADKASKEITAFLGMKCYNDDHVPALVKARGFLEFYERYAPSEGLLDSALWYVEKDKAGAEKVFNRDLIRIYFLKKQYDKVVATSSAYEPKIMSDAWTCYRVAEAHMEIGAADKALPWYARAVQIWPHATDFSNKYAICLLANGQITAAQGAFEAIVQRQPMYVSALTNLGFIAMQSGKPLEAKRYMDAAAKSDPDYEQNLINTAVWYHQEGMDKGAKACLEHLLSKHPTNMQARSMLQSLVQ